MKFYHFRQNNSGGRFAVNNDVDVHVLIEANSAEEANSIAESKGIYFHGVEDGMDCDCCGDRWSAVDESDGELFPHHYGRQIQDDEKGTVIHRYIKQ